MVTTYSPILIHPDAPTKPATGEVCNGCGVCCLVAPCPLGMVISRRRHGACAALRWQDETQQYRCAALTEPAQMVPVALAPALARLARRWIAAGQGCDSSLEVQRLNDSATPIDNSPPN
jgi:hypothetical protein